MLRSDIYNIITKKENPKNELFKINERSQASIDAEKAGLIAKGGKWYNSSGEYVAKTVDGKLNYISAPEKNAEKQKNQGLDTKSLQQEPDNTQQQEPKDTNQKPIDTSDTSVDYDYQLNQDFEERAPRLKKIRDSISEFFSRDDGDSQRQNIIDSDAKEGGLMGEVSAPGNLGSLVNEISTGYALEELIKNPSLTNEELEGLIVERIKDTKVAKNPQSNSIKNGKADKSIRSACNAARTEYFRVLDEIEKGGFDIENLSVSHVWGSKESLDNTVKYLEENGLEVNSKNIDEYREMIEGGGQGENSTDTMVLITDGEKASILHTSNKMTSDDLQGNSSPQQNMEITLGYVGDKFGEDSSEYKKVNSYTREAIESLDKEQSDLKKYISEKTTNAKENLGEWIEKAKKSSSSKKDGLDKYWRTGVVNRYYGSTSLNKNGPIQNLESLIENLKKNKVDVNEKELEEVVTIIEEIKDRGKIKKGEDIELSSEQEEKIAKLYIFEMEYGNQDDNHIETINDNMISLCARTLLDKPDEIKAFYDRQLEIQNEYKNKLNEISTDNTLDPPLGLGDEIQSRVFCERLHLNISTGHNPAGIPNENFASVFGLNESRLKVDEEDNLWVGVGNGSNINYHPYNMEDGTFDETVVVKSKQLQKKGLKSGSEGIVVNKETVARDLGFEPPIPEDFYKYIRVGDLEPSKGNTGNALIYRISRDGEQVPIGKQSVRSKKGVGGMPQDTVKFEKEFQTSLAIASHIWHQRFKNISK